MVTNPVCQELQHFGKNVPVILVGTKIDLRQDENVLKELADKGHKPITLEEVSCK